MLAVVFMEEDAIGALLEEGAAVGMVALGTVAAAVGIVDYRDRLKKEREAMDRGECPGR